MATGSISIGRGPDGTNIRVNQQGTGIPFGTPAKAAGYNPGTAAERWAIRMMQERARRRQRNGQPVKNGFTWQDNQREWEAAQAEADRQIAEAWKKYVRSTPRRNLDNASEFELEEFMPNYLRADRGRKLPNVTNDRLIGVPLEDPFAEKPSTPRLQSNAAAYPDMLAGSDAPATPDAKPLTLGSDAPGTPPPPSGLILGSDAPGSPPLDPVLEKYKKLRTEYLDALDKGDLDAPATGEDGDFGASSGNGQTPTTMGISMGSGFRYIIVDDGKGGKTIEVAVDVFNRMVAEAVNDPVKAGRLMASLAALGAYGADEKYVEQRVYPFINKDGKPELKGRFTVQDKKALLEAFAMLSADQANIADGVIANEGKLAEIPGFEQLLAQRGFEREQMAGSMNAAGTGGDGGGGGGYRRGGGGYGGGGGGGGRSGAARLTDVEQLKALADGIARQRLGRVLTVEEAQAFANYYHGLEQQSYNSYLSGGGGTMLDAESQAIAWIESRFNQENARQQQGSYVSTLLKMLQSSPFVGGSE